MHEHERVMILTLEDGRGIVVPMRRNTLPLMIAIAGGAGGPAVDLLISAATIMMKGDER